MVVLFYLLALPLRPDSLPLLFPAQKDLSRGYIILGPKNLDWLRIKKKRNIVSSLRECWRQFQE